MKMRWADVAGKLLHDDREEHQYECLSCGKPKLWINRDTGLWHCWSCGISGKFSGASTCTARINCFLPDFKPTRNWQGILDLLQADVGQQRTALTLLQNRVPVAHAERARILYSLVSWDDQQQPGIGIPMYLGDTPSGFQHWVPHGQLRYRTEGERGLAGGKLYSKILVLCEGLFDWLNLDAWVVSHGWFSRVVPLCTFGNTLTIEQVAEILERTHEDGSILIAFDNDKPGMACSVRQRLTSYRPTSLMLPPWKTEKCKDWDDALREFPQLADKFLQERFSSCSV
jgi:hypothetical protein